MTRITLVTCVLALLAGSIANADPREITLGEVLDLAEKHDPGIAASKSRDLAAEKSISVAQAKFLPTLEFQAIETGGFPGSSGVLGIGGVMGSSYRSGAAAGFVLTQTVWDFGRTTNAVGAAKSDFSAEEQSSIIYRNQVKAEASRAFFDCVRFRSQAETWGFIFENATAVASEVNRFVLTGQRSIVERYLANTQAEEAKTAQAAFEERAKFAKQRLGLLVGREPDQVLCPPLESVSDDVVKLSAAAETNPYVSRASFQADAAHSRSDQARAGFLPSVVAFGSVGALDNARLVEKQDYAVGAGFVFPLFDGWRTTSEVRRAEALAAEKDQLLEASREFVSVTNSRFDEVIQSERVRVEHLVSELKLAMEAYKVAHDRYFSFRGTLIDVREALRNLSRTRTQLIDSRTDLISALLAKSLFAAGKTP